MQTASNNRSSGAGKNKLKKMNEEGREWRMRTNRRVRFEVIDGGGRCRSGENRRREEGGRVWEWRERERERVRQ